MLIKTKGIIVRTKKYSESSVITDIYTEAKGLRSYIVSGVRAKRSKFPPGLLQVMSLVDMVAYHREDKDLTRIKELKAAHIYHQLPFEVVRRSVGIFMAEIIRKTIKEREKNSDLFRFLYDNFVWLDTSVHSVANLHLYFLVNLSAHLGFMPSDTYGFKTPFFDLKEGQFTTGGFDHTYFLDKNISKIFHQFISVDIENIHRISLVNAQRKQLLQQLLDYYGLHIDNFSKINSHSILEEVLH